MKFNIGETVDLIKPQEITGIHINQDGDEFCNLGNYTLPAGMLKKVEAATEDKPEPIQLYCTTSFDLGGGAGATQGKIYKFENHHIQYDGCTSAYFESIEEWKRGDPTTASRMFPLVKRPVKIGEWMYITNPSIVPLNNDGTPSYKQGDILKAITAETYEMMRFREGCDNHYREYIVAPGEYLVLDGYHPNETEQDKPEQPEPVKPEPHEFKVGGRVKFREWDDMATEFGLNEKGHVNITPAVFSTYMKHLCGTYATISNIRNKRVGLTDFTADDTACWEYNTDMLLPADDDIITRDMLFSLDACKPSLDFFDECHPNGQSEYSTLIEDARNDDSGRSDVAWIFAHKTKLDELRKSPYRRGDKVKSKLNGMLYTLGKYLGNDDWFTAGGYTTAFNASEFEPYTEPEYYSGKVVCIDDDNCPQFWTVGKIYEFVDGYTHYDDGMLTGRYKTLEQANHGIGSKFIELIEATDHEN